MVELTEATVAAAVVFDWDDTVDGMRFIGLGSQRKSGALEYSISFEF